MSAPRPLNPNPPPQPIPQMIKDTPEMITGGPRRPLPQPSRQLIMHRIKALRIRTVVRY